jgi:predicted CoA-binding protein
MLKIAEQERTALMQAVEDVDWDATTSERAAEIIIRSLSVKGFAVVPREPTGAMRRIWEDMEPEEILETDLDDVWTQLVAASHVED